MTAGRGRVHSEMPEQWEGRMRGFQLWVNLPAKDKMTDPRYQEFDAAKIPSVQPAAGVTVKAIAGEVDDGRGGSVRGPIAQPATDPLYLDIALDAGAVWEYALPRSEEHTSELQSLMRISYAVFCLKKKKKPERSTHTYTNKDKE